MDVDAYLRRRYEGKIADIQIVEKEDLDLVSHYIMLYKWSGLTCQTIIILQKLYQWFLRCYLQKNHLSGLRKTYLKISFDTVQQLMDVKRDLMHVVERNQEKFNASEAYESIMSGKRYAFHDGKWDCSNC